MVQGHEKNSDPLETSFRLSRASTSGEDGKLTLLDLLLILLRRKLFMVIGLFAVSCAAIAYSLLAQSYYMATATILPAKPQMGSPLGSLLGDLPLDGLLKGFNLLGNHDDNSRYLSILESRRLADILIAKYDLATRYGFKKKSNKKYYYESVLKEFHKNAGFYEDKLENINIAVVDTNPEFAALMANDIVRLLDSIAYEVNRESARGSRLFFEHRLNEIKHDLDSVHRAFAEFQVKNNFIDLDQQVKASIDVLAGLEADGIANEMEMKLMASSFGNNSRLAEMKRKKQVISTQLEHYLQSGSGSLVLPLKKTPELGIQYAYLYRDVKVEETLYAFILQMYEQAKLREANNAPVVTLLQPAQTPQKRARPKRAMICMLAFFAGFATLSVAVLVEHWFKGQKSLGTPTYFRLREVLGHLPFRK